MDAGLAERMLIREMIEGYFNALDREDRAALDASFAEQATSIYHAGSAKERSNTGRLEITSAQWRTRGTHPSQNFTVGSVDVRLTADGAEGTVFAVIQFVMDGQVTVSGMRYDDVYMREAGRWVIARRQHRRLWEYRLAAQE